MSGPSPDLYCCPCDVFYVFDDEHAWCVEDGPRRPSDLPDEPDAVRVGKGRETGE